MQGPIGPKVGHSAAVPTSLNSLIVFTSTGVFACLSMHTFKAKAEDVDTNMEKKFSMMSMMSMAVLYYITSAN